eukprot:scaffold108454_cov76-Phaeocystis_antarctica.AAC.5
MFAVMRAVGVPTPRPGGKLVKVLNWIGAKRKDYPKGRSHADDLCRRPGRPRAASTGCAPPTRGRLSTERRRSAYARAITIIIIIHDKLAIYCRDRRQTAQQSVSQSLPHSYSCSREHMAQTAQHEQRIRYRVHVCWR